TAPAAPATPASCARPTAPTDAVGSLKAIRRGVIYSWFVLSGSGAAMFKLAGSRGSREGVYCGREGLYVGSAALIERREGQYWIRDKDEIAEIARGGLRT